MGQNLFLLYIFTESWLIWTKPQCDFNILVRIRSNMSGTSGYCRAQVWYPTSKTKDWTADNDLGSLLRQTHIVHCVKFATSLFFSEMFPAVWTQQNIAFSPQWQQRLPKNIVLLSYLLLLCSSTVLTAAGSFTLSFSLPPAGPTFFFTSMVILLASLQ